MSRVTFGGWEIELQAQVIADPRGYDQPQALYDDPYVVYDGDNTSNWVSLNCQLLNVSAGHGGRNEAIPGVRANLGTLRASLYDPDRLLDPKVSPYAYLSRPGAPVRLVALQPVTKVVYPLWTGVTDTFSHDLLTGEGDLIAYDYVGRYTGVNAVDWERPTESSKSRYTAINNYLPQPLQLSYTGNQYNVCASKISGNLWSAGIVPAAESEQSVIWVDQRGTLRRRDLDSDWGNMLLATDCDDGDSDLIYTRLTSLITDDLLANIVLSERVSLDPNSDRPPRQSTNQASVNTFGARTLSELSLQLVDDAAMDLWRQRVLDLRAKPKPTVSGMTITLADALPWTIRIAPNVVNLEVGRALDINLTSRGKDSRWLQIIAGIRHSIDPESWEVDLELCDGTPALTTTSRYVYDATNALYDVPGVTYDVTTISTPIPAGV